ncbi:MAG: hypothetical protein OEX77_12015 [Candidatus Bathyarchaeota archaeon]|nr:hypothetical protein [Candidatus Bathyarchaeota archaeon]
MSSPENAIQAVLEEYSYLRNLDKQLLKIVKGSKAHKEEKLVVQVLLKVTDQSKV